MKILQRNIHWLILSLILVSILIGGLFAAAPPLPHFYLSNDFGTEALSIYNAEDGNCFVFLPSYAELKQVVVKLSSSRQVYLDDIKLTNGMACGQFEIGKPYPFSVGLKKNLTLWFYQSSNVATMFIHTETGSMDYIHADKNHKENSSITIYTADGDINFHTDSNVLKGRGNYTWSLDKRPYSIKLSSPADLLDMGTAANWILLANAADETNLNNYLVFELASRVGFSWVPECQYVDLYLNGEYRGLYLLTEKIEANVNRLNIDTTADDFLCKIDFSSRWDSLRNPFQTDTMRTIEICEPQILQQADYASITSKVNQMDSILLSGTDLSSEKVIDLDSWVCRYLIDEISANIDSDLASSYFYFSDGIFHAGPVWDYDMTFGNVIRNREPNSFIAKNEKKSEVLSSPYYNALYKNESFYNRMVNIYQLEFLPILQELINRDIEILANSISEATNMNSIRWKFMFNDLQQSYPIFDREPIDLIIYLEQRVDFLNQAWLENTDYCTVQFELAHGEPYWNISVPKGHLLETSYVDLDSTGWVDTSTGKEIDFNQPILTDMVLTPIALTSQAVSTTDSHIPVATVYYVVFLSMATLLILFFGIAIIDISRIKRKRRK